MQQYPHGALLFILLHLITIQQKITTASNARVSLTVNVMENAPAGLILADLRRDVDISSRYNTHVLSKLTFTFLSQKHNQLAFFSLDSRTGVLTLAKPIDRDAMCPQAVDCIIALTIAVQPVRFFLVISVTVHVVDINDNTPTFTKSQEILALSESTALGFIFPLPQARDIDSPAFGVTRYELRSDSRYFALNVRNASTTTVASKLMELDLQLVESLDFEEISFFRLLVVAYDGGNPAKTGHLLVEISVLDENDNSPKFEESVYEVTVVENRAYDSAVVNVRATDEDAGQNGLVTYAFSVLTDDSYSTYFQINRDSGNIYVVQPLDYEKHSFFVLNVIARDQGEPAAASALCKVVIHVVDVNDNPPVIAVNPHRPDGIIVIEEQLPIGSFVAHVSVTDADSHKGDGVLLCNYTADEGLTLLRMHGHEYKLVTSEVLDRENRSQVDVTIQCSDNSSPPLTSFAHLSIHLADINDNAPLFTETEYTLTVVENNPHHTLVGRVEARDPDRGANGTVRYRLGNDHTHYAYSLDPVSGGLTALSHMNREQHADDTLMIIAHDLALPSSLQLTSSVKVTVMVIDADDNVPTFAYQHVHFSINEGLQIGWRVGQVNATDRDLAPHNVFYYVIMSMTLIGGIGSGGANKHVTWPLPFDVDRKSGIIRTTQVLDRERQASYDFRVRALSNRTSARDSGRLDSVHVTVTVHDINDNPPVFDFPQSGGDKDSDLVHVSYAAPVGYIVEEASLHASDADIGRNADLTYAIVSIRQVHVPFVSTKVKDTRNTVLTLSLPSPSVKDVFVIETKSGLIVVNQSLLPYKDTMFNITVRVTDNGAPHPLSAMSFFYITINGSIEFEEPASKKTLSPKEGDTALLIDLDLKLSSFYLYATIAIAAFILLFASICCCCKCYHSQPRLRNISVNRMHNKKQQQKQQQRIKGKHAKKSESRVIENNGTNKKQATNPPAMASMYLLHQDDCVNMTEYCHSNGDAVAWQQQPQHKSMSPIGQLMGTMDKLSPDKATVDTCQPSSQSNAQWRRVRFTERPLPFSAILMTPDSDVIIYDKAKTRGQGHSPVSLQQLQDRPRDLSDNWYCTVPYLENHTSNNSDNVKVPHYATVPKRHSTSLLQRDIPYSLIETTSSCDSCERDTRSIDDKIRLRQLEATTSV